MFLTSFLFLCQLFKGSAKHQYNQENMTKRIKRNKLLNKFRHLQFNSRVNLSPDDIFDIHQYKVIKQISSGRNFFAHKPTTIIADPFLFPFNNELFLFYEELKGIEGTGIIKMIKTKDLINWSNPKTVLKENFHLSFPNVFKINNQIYMMPETWQNESIRLYKPNEDLTEWTFYKKILIDKSYVDSSIIQFNEKLYLFTTVNAYDTNLLKLYISDSIDSEWKEHPKSPITDNINNARCGGAVFSYNGTFYRPSQQYNINYGDGLDINVIEHLSPTEYKEKKMTSIMPNSEKFYSLGGHHISVCRFNNKNIVATDALAYSYNFFEIVKRIVFKFSKYNAR